METKHLILSILVMASTVLNQACTKATGEDPLATAIKSEGRTDLLFNAGWLFYRDSLEQAEQPGFDDSSWRLLDLPHDWSIEDIPGTGSPIDSNAIGGTATGFHVGGTGWYRKKFLLPRSIEGKKFQIYFEGVYMNAEIWLNGKKVGINPHGYTSFRFDITSSLVPGKENVLAVKVRNEGKNTRWYSGSGIYRHVWLHVMDPIHLDPWGLFITTPQVGSNQSSLRIQATVYNGSDHSREVKLLSRIIDPSGNQVAQLEMSRKVSAGGNADFTGETNVLSPALWSPENPSLYTAISELSTGADPEKIKINDRLETRFGIRSIAVNAKEGFLLNGQPLLLKGGCMHHDNGPLGAAAFDRAEERRVELMKASGFNAIRSSHNPPSPAFLDACDRLGILVIDEAFDMWRKPKTPQDYHLYFDEWWKKDIESMVFRDRNHPSVVMWSIGNEIPERGEPEGYALAQQLSDYVRQLDNTRMITSGVHYVNPDQDPFFATLDVAGYNYAAGNYVKDHQRLPDRIIVSTESHPPRAFEFWMGVVDYPWVIGDFVWTGYDYLGEASIGWLGLRNPSPYFPWTHAYCGDIDICGWKRPQSFYRDVLWGDGKQLSIFVKPPVPTFPFPDIEGRRPWNWQDVAACWNWQGYEGKELEIEVYSSCPEVELFLNDKSLGRKKTNRSNKWIARWRVPYEAGALSAKGYEGNKVLATSELRTAGEVTKIAISADRTTIGADGQDLSYITVQLLDDNGIRNPVAENLVNFEIQGPGSIVAVGSSNPRSTESYKQPRRKVYQGRCQVIIRSENKPGEITLKASSQGLATAEIVISSSL
jgi:beta-galactosidase